MNPKKSTLSSLFILIILLVTACNATSEITPTPQPQPTATIALDLDSMESAVFTAVLENNNEVLKEYIAAGINVNETNDVEMTLLDVATERANSEAVAALLAADATINTSAFQSAILNDNVEIVRLFIESGVDVNEPRMTDIAYTPLIQAARTGNVEIGQLLLENGAELEILDNYDDTALCVAAYFGNLEFVEMLVEAGADLDVVGYNDLTPLGLAKSNDHQDVVSYLESVGAME